MKTLVIALAALITTSIAQANTDATGFVCKGVDSPIKLKILFHESTPGQFNWPPYHIDEDLKASTLLYTPKGKQVFKSAYKVGGMTTRYGYEMRYTSQLTPNLDVSIWLQAHEYSPNYTTIVSWFNAKDKKYELKCVGFPKAVATNQAGT